MNVPKIKVSNEDFPENWIAFCKLLDLDYVSSEDYLSITIDELEIEIMQNQGYLTISTNEDKISSNFITAILHGAMVQKNEPNTEEI